MKAQKVGKMAIFSVGAVLFSAHAGGGFATGNQANTYYVGLGWTGIVSAIIAMLLLILTMREAMMMYNQRNLTSAKELFENLYHPFDKLEILFEIFFNIMVLMAVAAAISGAASALQQYFGFNYYACVVAVGIVVLCLTIFGASVVRMASTYMGMAILVTAIVIYLCWELFSIICSNVVSSPTIVTHFFALVTAVYNKFRFISMRGPERSGMTTAGYSDPCDLWIVTAYASSSSSSSLYEYSTIRPSSKFTVMVSAKSLISSIIPVSPLNTPVPLSMQSPYLLRISHSS